MSLHAAVLDQRGAVARVAEERARGLSIVLTNGCFDLLHAGHVHLLRSARAEGDRLYVAVNDDESVRRLKGPPRPLVPLADRLTVLAALRAVDAVFAFSEDTPLASIEALRPDVLVKGADYAPEEIVGAERVTAWGGRVVRVSLLPGRSTTRLTGHRDR